MTTPPIELAATVERVEIPTVEEIHEATTRILADPLLHKVVDWIGVSMREVGRHYTPAPSLAETGAVPVEAILYATDRLMDLANRHSVGGSIGPAEKCVSYVKEIRAWLATQKVPR